MQKPVFMLFSMLIVGTLLAAGCIEIDTDNDSSSVEFKTWDVALTLANGTKATPDSDIYPPVSNVPYYSKPQPFASIISTPGGEDSGFMTLDGQDFYFFFTPDVSIPVEKQLIDGVTGIWWIHREGTEPWSVPKRIALNDDVSLDGCQQVDGNTMWFCSVRAGNHNEIDFYKATNSGGDWSVGSMKDLNLNPNQLGEFHFTNNGNRFWYGSGGAYDEQSDIYYMDKMNGEWQDPVMVENVNTPDLCESQPWVSPDEDVMVFTGMSRHSVIGPAVFRSEKRDGVWQPAVEVISSFAGEPSMDRYGNIYFTHHYYDADGDMLEADIYVSYFQG